MELAIFRRARPELDVSQSTAHRLMAMLVFHNFAVQDPERVTSIGLVPL